MAATSTLLGQSLVLMNGTVASTEAMLTRDLSRGAHFAGPHVEPVLGDLRDPRFTDLPGTTVAELLR